MDFIIFFAQFAYKTVLKRIFKLLNKDTNKLYQSIITKIIIRILRIITKTSKNNQELFVKMYTYLILLSLVFLCIFYSKIPSHIDILEKILTGFLTGNFTVLSNPTKIMKLVNTLNYFYMSYSLTNQFLTNVVIQKLISKYSIQIYTWVAKTFIYISIYIPSFIKGSNYILKIFEKHKDEILKSKNSNSAQSILETEILNTYIDEIKRTIEQKNKSIIRNINKNLPIQGSPIRESSIQESIDISDNNESNNDKNNNESNNNESNNNESNNNENNSESNDNESNDNESNDNESNNESNDNENNNEMKYLLKLKEYIDQHKKDKSGDKTPKTSKEKSILNKNNQDSKDSIYNIIDAIIKDSSSNRNSKSVNNALNVILNMLS